MSAPGAPADFLGRLAARALGQTPPLAPRPAEPFEGSAGLAEEAVEAAPLAAVESPRPSPARPAAPVDLPPADSPRSALADRPEPLSRRHSDHAPEGPPQSKQDLAHASETPALKGQTLNSLGLQPQVSDPHHPLRPEGAVPFALETLGEARPLSASRRESLPSSLPSLSVPGAVTPTYPSAADAVPPRRPREPQTTERIAEFSASLTPRATLERDSLPLAASFPASPRGDNRPAAPAAEPAIRVTIGRIEVRAVAPAAPATPAARPAAPRLGLAEYLRRRGEGRP
jgi:hypothetical protein